MSSYPLLVIVLAIILSVWTVCIVILSIMSGNIIKSTEKREFIRESCELELDD